MFWDTQRNFMKNHHKFFSHSSSSVLSYCAMNRLKFKMFHLFFQRNQKYRIFLLYIQFVIAIWSFKNVLLSKTKISGLLDVNDIDFEQTACIMHQRECIYLFLKLISKLIFVFGQASAICVCVCRTNFVCISCNSCRLNQYHARQGFL